EHLPREVGGVRSADPCEASVPLASRIRSPFLAGRARCPGLPTLPLALGPCVDLGVCRVDGGSLVTEARARLHVAAVARHVDSPCPGGHCPGPHPRKTSLD